MKLIEYLKELEAFKKPVAADIKSDDKTKLAEEAKKLYAEYYKSIEDVATEFLKTRMVVINLDIWFKMGDVLAVEQAKSPYVAASKLIAFGTDITEDEIIDAEISREAIANLAANLYNIIKPTKKKK